MFGLWHLIATFNTGGISVQSPTLLSRNGGPLRLVTTEAPGKRKKNGEKGRYISTDFRRKFTFTGAATCSRCAPPNALQALPFPASVFSTEVVNSSGKLEKITAYRCAQLHRPLDPVVADRYGLGVGPLLRGGRSKRATADRNTDSARLTTESVWANCSKLVDGAKYKLDPVDRRHRSHRTV
jgi:hypothetical protein